MSARETVLARIRTALQSAPGTSPGAADEARDVPRTYRVSAEHPPGHPALVDLLIDRLVDYKAGVRRIPGDDLATAVMEPFTQVRSRLQRAKLDRPLRVVVPPGLDESWLASIDAEVVRDDGLDPSALDGFDGVITAAAVAVAETGTIVLDGSDDQGRRAITLVPDLHVCVVRTDQIVAGVPQAIAQLDPTRPLTWISGPSATSDIELNRVEGVHGPRTLHVIVVEQTG